MERAHRFDHPLSMLMFDLDNFKDVNDTYGHGVGDLVLKQVADVIRAHTRKINLLIRWGGDEFIVIPVETSLDGAAVLSERLRQAIEFFAFERAGKLTASFGVVQFKDEDTETTILKRLDDALYRAKNSGGNRVEKG
jgi:diguanylate cyclase (GGDEF)-like protein